MSLSLNYAALSDSGLIRDNNEDSAYAGPRLLAIADGMGGHAAGEVASQLMIAAISRLDSDEPGDNLLEELRTACFDGNYSIATEIEDNPETKGMGTTLTALLFSGTRLGMCHVGDSRGYLLRDGELIQLTHDDTYVQSLVDDGQISAEEASMHPMRSMILKALTGKPVEPTLVYREVRKGDRYLLCSDGLSDPVSAATIQDALAEGTPREAAEKLISFALRSGGPDNVTVVVADVVDSAVETPTTPIVTGALNTSAEAVARPDTPGVRAAAFRESPPAQVVVTTEPEKRQSKGSWLVIAVVAVLVLSVVGIGVWGWNKKESMYHLAVVDNQVQVRHGVSGTLLGYELSETHQYVCLTDANEVQLPQAGTDREAVNCHIMTPEDLSPAARESLNSLPADSYNGVSEQIGRLAEEALPVCLTVANSDEGERTKAQEDSTNERLGSQPGVNCREVRR